jgi:glycosyltransferase involved in cell wall biosynthesis
MAEALSQRGHHVHVVTYHLGDENYEVPFRIHRIRGIRTYRKYSPGPTYQKLLGVDFLLFLKLAGILKKYKFDLIHAHHYEGLFVALPLSRLTKLPLIYDAHTLLESELPFYKLGLTRDIKKRIGRRLDLGVPKQANHIISVTDDIKRKMIDDAQVVPDNITVIPNGVEWKHFDIRYENQKKTQFEEKTVVFAGNPAPYQGIELLYKAFAEVLKKRQDVRLIIISDQLDRHNKNLTDLLEIGKNIDVITSDFDSLPKHIAKADVAVSPRVECDGLPQKVLNYMAAGKPIVSFEGSAKDLKHAETALVVENNDIIAFADAILRLLEDAPLAIKLGANAKKKMMTEYTWENTAKKTEAVYERLSGKKR